jgi:hypothetical protein
MASPAMTKMELFRPAGIVPRLCDVGAFDEPEKSSPFRVGDRQVLGFRAGQSEAGDDARF